MRGIVSQPPYAKRDSAAESIFLPIDGNGKVKCRLALGHQLDLIVRSAPPLQVSDMLAPGAGPGKLLYPQKLTVSGWVIDIPNGIYDHAPSFVFGLDYGVD